jgi:hypothetical protein
VTETFNDWPEGDRAAAELAARSSADGPPPAALEGS